MNSTKETSKRISIRKATHEEYHSNQLRNPIFLILPANLFICNFLVGKVSSFLLTTDYCLLFVGYRDVNTKVDKPSTITVSRPRRMFPPRVGWQYYCTSCGKILDTRLGVNHSPAFPGWAPRRPACSDRVRKRYGKPHLLLNTLLV